MSTSKPHFKVYVYYSPETLPFQRSDDWDPDLIRAAGFEPSGEITQGFLIASWNGHPKGSVVVTGPRETGKKFAILIE